MPLANADPTAAASSATPPAPLVSTVGAQAATIHFDKLPADETPTNWTATLTGKGDPKWTVVRDATAPSQPNVLKQSGQATFPLCLKDDTNLKDGFVKVRFKPVSGRSDQAGGLVWRAKDPNNYYVARANALEDNVTLYRVLGGKRVALKSVDAKVASGKWHVLGVEFAGNRFAVTFDGKTVITAADDRLKEAGQVGVWTKADSVTLFDDFSYGAR
jgi:hypothetical protein